MMTFGRRSLLLGAGAACLPLSRARADALPVPPGDEIAFAVIRNGSKIGEHHIAFTRAGDALTTQITVDLLVKMLDIDMFRYTLSAQEHWSNGAFQAVASKVNYNGTPLSVEAARANAGFKVQGTKVQPYVAPPSMMALSFWNKAMLMAPVLNLQTGHTDFVKSTSPGWNNVPTANGGTILAQAFVQSGVLHETIWYDEHGQWSALLFDHKGHIQYEKIIST